MIAQSSTVRPDLPGLPFVGLPIPSRERPRLSLFASLFIHTLIILGVGFTATVWAAPQTGDPGGLDALKKTGQSPRIEP